MIAEFSCSTKCSNTYVRTREMPMVIIFIILPRLITLSSLITYLSNYIINHLVATSISHSISTIQSKLMTVNLVGTILDPKVVVKPIAHYTVSVWRDKPFLESFYLVEIEKQ